ncbi:uncharacterized protein LOC124148084 [Haliotis rufescens]|uniref:uncharacterized protein LOC124148084 n=1 Tax=Haliotis rufescens TaxID=6454 RepID=UPI00201F08F0|nr:uncharacterized protein LOC124148084 [Haliotis rufescens]
MVLSRGLWLLLTYILQHSVNGGSCPDDVVSVSGGKCYFIANTSKKSTSATHYCNDNYKNKAFPDTLVANNEIKSHLLRLNPTCNTAAEYRYWIDLRRTEAIPHFHVGSNATRLPYTDWNPHKPVPEDTFGSHNCGIFACSKNLYWWENISCSKSRNFICEMKECPHSCNPAAETSTTAVVNTMAFPNTTSTTQDVTTVELISNTTSVDTENVLSNTTMPTQFHMGSTASVFEASLKTAMLMIPVLHFSS